MTDLKELLRSVAETAADYRATVDDRPVHPSVDAVVVAAALGELPPRPVPAADVITRLVGAVEPGLVGSTGGRYFGFVVGGALDAATAADVLAVGWDQLAFNEASSPAAAGVEEVVGRWLKDLLGLPAGASFGLVTGGQGANTVGLAAARQHVLARVGWDVGRDGLFGAPPIRVIASDERHATIDRALRMLGVGTSAIDTVDADRYGAIDIGSLERTLRDLGDHPTIVCAQAGNVNTGAIDDLVGVTDHAHARGAWVHVDGAFGLWAAASPTTRSQIVGLERADSWATDGHKWLNVPYDSGYVFCAHPDDHVAAMAYSAAYLTGQAEPASARAPSDFVPESSRRARGFATWAALSQLGRSGVAELVERCCSLARRFATRLGAVDGVTIGNEVNLNQVLVSFGDDARTDAVIASVQESGECWMGGTTWHGRRWMRISVSSWRTTEADVERSVAAILDAHARVG